MNATGPAPDRFGPYKVESRIGAGGMGVVYQALDEALQRHVALKTLLPALAADPEFVARFKREAQSAAALNHPNITQIYTIGQEGALPFFAMEFIRGRSLEALVRDGGPIDPLQATGYILQAARGLRHAAQKSLIHRDVKPSNLMLTEDGVVKITDFGLAKAARAEAQLTATGEVLGSPGYISPEQAQGQAIDARSDIYSLGATFYQLATGRLPFEAPTPVAMIVKHLNEPLRSPRMLNPKVPFPVAACIQKMMAKRPGERFQDYDALIRELERAIATAQPAAPAREGAVAGPGPAAAAPAWSAMTGIEGRPRLRAAEATPVRTAAEGPRGSWFPIILAGAIGVLIVAGIVHNRRAAAHDRATGGDMQASVETGFSDSAAAPGARHGRDPAFHVGRLSDRTGATTRFKSDERFAQRLRSRNPANLIFDKHDHEILEDGTLRVYGEVTNRGGSPAAQSRVRVRIMTEQGTLAIQGEAELQPALVLPGATAIFSLPLNYDGPVGTIKAELAWVE
jgi:predicted Ser/Thr protein kinase